MLTLVRVVLGLLAGMAIAFVLVIAVELFSAVVHPFPEGFSGSHEETCAHVARYPHWVLAVVVPLWSATIYLSTWIARKIGFVAAAANVATLLVVGILFNVAMLPYPVWFKVAAPLSAAIAGLAILARRGATPETAPGPTDPRPAGQ